MTILAGTVRTYTAGDQINGALRLIGQLAEAEEPSAATAQDALASMNQMIDSWSTELLLIFTTLEQIFYWLLNFNTRTLSTTGDFASFNFARWSLDAQLDLLFPVVAVLAVHIISLYFN